MTLPDLKTWATAISVCIALSSLAVTVGSKLKDQENNTKSIEKLFEIAERQSQSINFLESSIKSQAEIMKYHKYAIDKNTAMIEKSQR